MGLWVGEVDTVSKDFCKVMEDDVKMGSDDGSEAEGSLVGTEEMPVAGAPVSFKDRKEGVFESAAGREGTDSSVTGDTDSEDLGDGVLVATSGRGRTEGILWAEGASALIWEHGVLESVTEGASGRKGLADFLCFDLGEG